MSRFLLKNLLFVTDLTVKYGQTRTVVIKVYFRKKTLLGYILHPSPLFTRGGSALDALTLSPRAGLGLRIAGDFCGACYHSGTL